MTFESYYREVEARAALPAMNLEGRVRRIHNGETAMGLLSRESAEVMVCIRLAQSDIPALVARCRRLESALRGIYGLVETGQLVRDIGRDAEPDFALRMVPVVMALCEVSECLAASPGSST